MRALVYRGPGQSALEDRPKPVIGSSTDAVAGITKTTIWGTDLHILKGDVPTVVPGRSVTRASRDRPGWRIGFEFQGGRSGADRLYSYGAQGGWILGNTIDGTQAEYVRIPSADNSLYHIPAGAGEDALVMLSDMPPTGYECGVLIGMITPGDTVAIAGARPIGLARSDQAGGYSDDTLATEDSGVRAPSSGVSSLS